MEILLLVLSDLHLGKGRFLENGQLNILEDFEEDDRFVEFVDYYCTEEYEDFPVHIILNGDILNLIQVDIDGVFTSLITEELAVRALEKIILGHPRFFNILQCFLKKPNKKLTYIIGNHDAGMKWELPQKKFMERVEGTVEFSLNIVSYGVHIEHGHRFENINSVPLSKYFREGPNGEELLNLPWGSLFCIEILPRLKKERPYIDRVRPLSAYIKWCLIHDFYFFIRMSFIIVNFIINELVNHGPLKKWNWKGTFIMLKQLTLYPKYEKQAKGILKKNSEIHTVIMGHTHLKEWRKFPQEKFYFNTGTWNHIPSMDSGLHQNETILTYISVRVNYTLQSVVATSMNVWQGKWRPYRESINLERGSL